MTERTCIINGSLYRVGDVLPPDEFPMIEDAYRIETPSPTRWYVVQTNPNCEAKVETGLVEANADVYLPRLTKWQKIPERMRKPRGAAREPVTRPLFPGYVFLGWSRSGEPPWLPLRRVDGIRAVLRPGSFRTLAVEILVLRGAEISGALNQCVNTSRKKRGKPIGTIPQFVGMDESERMAAFIRRVKGVEPVA